MSEIIEKVETFIQRLHDLDYIITPEAATIIYSSKSDMFERGTLSSYLSRRITEYEENKDEGSTKQSYARICHLWMIRAFSCGVVQEGNGLARKLKECREKNVQLERHNKVLSEEYLNLKMIYEDFTSRMTILDENDLEKQR